MARTLSAAMLAAIAANRVRPVLLAELEFADGFVRAWTGVGDLSFDTGGGGGSGGGTFFGGRYFGPAYFGARYWGAGSESSGGAVTFTGLGTFVGVSPIQEASDLTATGLTFSLSGIPAAILSAAIGQLRYGKAATLWVGFIDVSTNLLVETPVIMFQGLTDNAEISDGADTAEVKLTAENRLITLERPRKRRYTTEDQKLVDATDQGFDFVPGLQEFNIRWGTA